MRGEGGGRYSAAGIDGTLNGGLALPANLPRRSIETRSAPKPGFLSHRVDDTSVGAAFEVRDPNGPDEAAAEAEARATVELG